MWAGSPCMQREEQKQTALLQGKFHSQHSGKLVEEQDV